MIYFSRKTQLEKHLGSKYKYESIEIGAEAETFKEAKEEVHKYIQEYVDEMKEQENSLKRYAQEQRDAFPINDEIAGGEGPSTSQQTRAYEQINKLK